MDGAGATIGGATVAARNVISGQREAIIVRASGDNAVIRNNYIGTDVSGTAAVGDRYGIWVDQATGVDIGGPTSADRNVISGQSVGVLVMGTGADGTQIRNNYIGTDKTGSVDLGNSFGVELATQSTTTQVGAGPAQGNLISGNGTGVYVASGSTGNIIDDNEIGPDALGNTGIGNSIGIEVNDTGTATVDNSYSNTIAFNTGTRCRGHDDDRAGDDPDERHLLERRARHRPRSAERCGHERRRRTPTAGRTTARTTR